MKEKSNPSNNQSIKTPPNEVPLRERIEKRAYHIWLVSGSGHGEHLTHWLGAEAEVLKAIKQEQEEPGTAGKTKPAIKLRSAPVANDVLLNK